MSLKDISKIYKDIQKLRIQLSNKNWAAENGRSSATPRVYVDMQDQLEEMEKKLVKTAKDELKYHPAWTEFMQHVKGMGPTLAAQLIGFIDNVERFATPSKLWKYSGLACIDGKAQRMTKGQSAGYNPRFKALMYNIGTSFIKSNSPYREIYDHYKEKYAEQRDWTPKHVHLAALRKMEKIFLAHVWEKWNEALGNTTRKEYVFEYLGHTTRFRPEDFMTKKIKIKAKTLEEVRKKKFDKLVS